VVLVWSECQEKRMKTKYRADTWQGLSEETKNQAHGVWQVFNIDCDAREMGDASTTALDRG
jgi:hypothetical protein